MKILVISQKIPYPLTDGESLCIYNIFKRLASKHEIYLLSFSSGSNDRDNLIYLKNIFAEIDLIEKKVQTRSFSRYLMNVLSWNTGFLMKEQQPGMYNSLRAKLHEIINSKNIDIVLSVSLVMAEFTYDVRSCINVLYIIDSNTLALKRQISMNYGTKLGQKLRDIIWYMRIKNYEKRMIGNCDLCITVGKQDLEVLRQMSSDANIALIPNGVDTEYYCEFPKEASLKPTLLFTGNMGFPPNVDAVIYFCNDIFPLIKDSRPDVHLIIVGKSPADNIKRLAEDEHIEITGYVEDTRPYIAKADVVICPMRMGGGIKNKILEAMASGRPVVTTSIGAEGFNVRNGVEIMVGDTPSEFAGHVLQLLHNPPLRKSIAESAKRMIDENYTWNIMARRFETQFGQLIKNKFEDKGHETMAGQITT